MTMLYEVLKLRGKCRIEKKLKKFKKLTTNNA